MHLKDSVLSRFVNVQKDRGARRNTRAKLHTPAVRGSANGAKPNVFAEKFSSFRAKLQPFKQFYLPIFYIYVVLTHDEYVVNSCIELRFSTNSQLTFLN